MAGFLVRRWPAGGAGWAGLLAAYVSAGGAALAADADVWAVLDPFARAATVHRAAAALARADEEGRVLDEAEQAFVDACARMAAHHRTARRSAASLEHRWPLQASGRRPRRSTGLSHFLVMLCACSRLL